jgi:hypothetical protein
MPTDMVFYGSIAAGWRLKTAVSASSLLAAVILQQEITRSRIRQFRLSSSGRAQA